MSAGFNDFNLSTKKEDVSIKLKVHDIKRAKNETKKLATEGRKMEERLTELKLAMNREKEERERQGGGFWKSGQQGTLNNYAEEVLTKKKSKSAGKGKIKILRDKPLDLPERSNQPGTMAYIAQKGSLTPRDKPRGPRCGQCEERGAAVSCMQCSEDYCAGCFAAFHLKGNLKKHRSVPLTATPRQCFASPRPSPAQSQSSYDFQQGDGAVAPYIPNSARKKDRNSPEGASGTYDSHLLAGDYNEAEQAASFQDALQAWRNEKAAAGSGGSAKSERSRKTPTPRGGVPYSPVQTPTVSMDHSTGTLEDKQDVEIKFNTNTISYADRLLLKKHRRTDVDALFTPRDGDMSAGSTPRETPRQRSGRPLRERSTVSMKMEDFDDNDFDTEDRVDFQSLFAAVQPLHTDPSLHKDPDTISIVEVQESVSDPSVEQAMSYKVKEEGLNEAWSTDVQSNSPTFKVKPPSSAKSSRRRSARKSVRLSVDNSNHLDSNESSEKRVKSSKNKDILRGQENCDDSNSRLLGAKLNDVENEMIRKRQNKTETLKSPHVTSATVSQERVSPPSISKSNTKPPSDSSKSRPDSSKSRPKSGKSRPQTENRTQSRQGAQSRTTSRQGSRPGSRSNSRLGSSRASSRADNPGLLTKGPSEALTQIARMTATTDTYKGIDSFFMVGVEPAEQEERTLTPTQHKNNKDEKIKVSYQLYNMAPRSWKPDFSLADVVPVDNVENEDAEDERASSVMAYHAYSEQMVSDITERLMSRFGELPLDEDSLSDRSSGGAYRSLGEEYRTFTPRSHSSSVQGSPVISARGTPVPFQTNSRPQIRDSTQVSGPSPRKSTRDPPAQTPRQSAKSRAQTPRVSSSRVAVQTPRRSKTFHGEPERPMSRAIVMEGTDLSIFDNVGEKEYRNEDDEETLDKLEWELASQSGRLTADGNISRMEIMDEPSDDSLNNSVESFRSLSRLGQDHGYDINSKLRKDELDDDEDAEGTDDEEDVRNLM